MYTVYCMYYRCPGILKNRVPLLVQCFCSNHGIAWNAFKRGNGLGIPCPAQKPARSMKVEAPLWWTGLTKSYCSQGRSTKVQRLKPKDLKDLQWFPTWPDEYLWSIQSARTRQSKESKKSLCCRSQRNGDSAIKWSEKDLSKGPMNCCRSKIKGWIAACRGPWIADLVVLIPTFTCERPNGFKTACVKAYHNGEFCIDRVRLLRHSEVRESPSQFEHFPLSSPPALLMVKFIWFHM